MRTIINADEIPADLPAGSYCCRLDESSTLTDIRVRFVMPPHRHEPGDCLVQAVKADVCDRCGQPVTQDTVTGKWRHSEVADEVFCNEVMLAPDRVAARDGDPGA
jgi:hypothetical protein